MMPLSARQKQVANRALARFLIRFAVLSLFTLLAEPAFAYVGESLLNWTASYIVAPLGLIAIVVALAASVWRPDLVRSAIYAAIICAVLFFLIQQGNTIMNALQH